MNAFVNGQILPYTQAHLHVSDLAIHRGFGVFDFFKIENDTPYFLDDYMDRFYNSAETLRLTVPFQRQELKEVMYELIRQNRIPLSGMKLILTGGYSPDGYQPSTPNFIITQHQLALPPLSLLDTGVKIITHEYVREIPSAKTINYTMGISLIEQINASNAYDVLYVKDGVVSEFPRSNFFIVDENDTIATPERNVLKGVTRKNILNIASRYYKVEERDISLQEVFRAKEAFITSTTKRLIPIIDVNGNRIGRGVPGNITSTLYQKLVDFEKQYAGR